MKIIIADDHPIFRQGLVRIVEGVPNVEVVGEAGDGKAALNLIVSQSPEIAVLDISMPMMSGLDVVRSAREQGLRSEFIILTMFQEEEYFSEAIDLGVKGYLLKESAGEELLDCLQSVGAGSYFVSSKVSHYLVKRSQEIKKYKERDTILGMLTPTELRVLKLIAQNKTSKEIADELHVSFRTVQNHRTNMCEKLSLEGHNKLLEFALRHKSLL